MNPKQRVMRWQKVSAWKFATIGTPARLKFML